MKKSDKLKLFQLLLQDEFKLKHRVNFAKNKFLRFDGDPCMGMYEGTKFSEKKIIHKIRLSTSEIKSDRDLFCTLAHEYVHAWQTEHDLDLGHDDKSGFTQWREYFNDTYKVDIVSF
jgi:hypothetical protein